MKKAIIICYLDNYANSIKPNALKKFLEEHDYTVALYPTSSLGRLGNTGLARLLPYPDGTCLKLYFLEGLHLFARKQKNRRLRKMIISSVLQRIIEARGVLLQEALFDAHPNILICENSLDQAVMNKRLAEIQMLDLPSPFAEEIFYGGELSLKKFEQMKKFEKELYAKADHLSFHWHTYSDFVKKEKYDGDNFITLDQGIYPKTKRAHFLKQPKIVFLGYLAGYWVNRPLLEKLSALYPNIDVYGGPEIQGLKVNYKGYAPTLEMLADYQFGLVTITDDPLRRSSFSSKQIEYYSYGLPVLVPEWRNDELLDPGAVHYNTENFIHRIQEYTDQKKWEEKSDVALAISRALAWEKTLAPLEDII